jgi:glycine oxidase
LAKLNIVYEDDFLIVGAGAIGLSIAWELSRRGQSVSVIESPDNQLRSASWAGAGIFPPPATKNIDDPNDQLRAFSHNLHGQWATELRRDTGIDTGFRQCGGIYLATSRAELATLTANQYWWDEHGIAHHRLTFHELVQLEPNLACLPQNMLLGAWRLPEECQLRNPRHLKALKLACQQYNVRFIPATIRRLEIRNDNSAELIDDQETCHRAAKICLCSGAWTRLLMEQVNLNNGIMPIRGQMLLYKSERPLLANILNDGNRYMVARDDGHLLVGSVEEEAGFACETTAEALTLLCDWAEGTLPAIRELPLVDCWAGLRPGSYDGFPYLGLAPRTTNLYVAAGHFRSGLHLSCGTGVIMADLMLGRPVAIDLTPFRLGRG